MGRRSRITRTHRDSPGLTGTHRDSPGLTRTHRDLPGLTGGRFALGSKANWQGGDGAPPRGRRPTVVDGRTWVSGTDVKEQMDWEVRGVHLRTKGSWRRSTGIRSRAAGSQVRNDGRLRCPSLLLNGIGCADDPGGQPFNGVGAVRRSASGKANQVSPLIPGVAATGSSLTSLSGWTGCPLSGHPCFHVLRVPTCVLAVNLTFAVLPIWLR